MTSTTAEFARLVLRRWLRDQVDWLLVGGQAMVAHGMSRCRRDVDLLLASEAGNVDRALAAVREVLGLVPECLADRLARVNGTGRVARFRDGEWATLELFTGLPRVPWAELRAGRVWRTWERMRVPTVSVTGLVAIKRDSVRTHGPGSHHAADLAALLSASAFDIASEA